jgi:diacylglycerol kinase
MSQSLSERDDVEQEVESRAHRFCRSLRSPLRQRFIDLERGLTLSFRGDSVFFVHIFSAIIICCIAIVFQASIIHWLILFVSSIVVLTAEIFHQALIHVAASIKKDDPANAEKIQKISTAAEMVCIIGVTLTILIVLADCSWGVL